MATRDVVTATLLAALLAACTAAPTVGPAPTPSAPGTPFPSSSATPSTPPDADLPTAIPLPVTPTSRLRIGLDRDPSSLDPALVTDDAGLMVVDAVFDSLTRMSDDLTQVLPAAAESWEVSADGLVWTFDLREADEWHDGLPVAASQFVRAFSHVATNADGAEPFNAHLLSSVAGWGDSQERGVALAGVRAPSTDTLEVTLTSPLADFPAVVSHPALAPRRLSLGSPDRPVGNGPFRLDDPWAHNQFIRVTAVETHHDAPSVGEVVFQIYAGTGSASLQVADFRAGVLDVAQVPPLEVDEVRTEFGVSEDGYSGPGLLEGVTDEVYWIGFNTAAPPFDDPDVRLGVSQLLDRDMLIERYTASTRTRATGIVPGGLPGSGAIDCAPCRHDPLNAAVLLADLAARVDGPVRILTVDGVTNRAIADSLADALRDVTGVRVVVEAPPLGEWLARVRGPSLQVFRGGWEASWPAMGGVLAPSFHSSHVGGDNLVRLADPAVDAAIEDAQQVEGLEALPSWQAVEQQVADVAAVAPVFWYRHNVVVADDVAGFTMDPSGRVDLSRVVVDAGGAGG